MRTAAFTFDRAKPKEFEVIPQVHIVDIDLWGSAGDPDKLDKFYQEQGDLLLYLLANLPCATLEAGLERLGIDTGVNSQFSRRLIDEQYKFRRAVYGPGTEE